MAKGVLANLSGDTVDLARPGALKSSAASTASSSRASVLASVVPMLRRHADDAQKAALLTLQLSGISFLDTTVTDDVTEQPLYSIKTFGPTTTIKRADPWDGDTKTAEIRWSRIMPSKGKNETDGVLINMRGVRWKGSETLLKRGTANGGRKFNIPNYSQSLKWKRQGNTYSCTTSAVKGPIATLHSAANSFTPSLQIFETLHDKNDARPMLVHHGVSTLLLDYLLVTALFLVTDAQEWTQIQGADISIPIGDVPELPGLTTPKSAPSNFSTSNKQWRKIMYGEPIYTNRSESSSSPPPSDISLPEELLPSEEFPPFPEELVPAPISAEQLAKIKYGHPIYPSRRSLSPTPTSDSEDVSEHIFFSPSMARSQSPAAESIFSPHSRGAAPSHTYLDPSFYSDDEVPPVPSIPAHFTRYESSQTPRSRPSSSQSIASTSARRLPEVPLPPVPPLIPRPRSTPPRPRTSPSIPSLSESMSGPSSPPLVPVLDPAATPRRPSRQLPRPPQTPISTENRQLPTGLSRTRSHSQSHSVHEREKWRPHAPYSQRTLPSPPTSSSRASANTMPLQLQRILSEDGRYIIKDVDDEHWVGAPEEAAAYDMPPPAYNSINFSPVQGPASPMQ